MTELLQHALGEVHKLAAADQDTIAALILEELEDEARWVYPGRTPAGAADAAHPSAPAQPASPARNNFV